MIDLILDYIVVINLFQDYVDDEPNLVRAFTMFFILLVKQYCFFFFVLALDVGLN